MNLPESNSGTAARRLLTCFGIGQRHFCQPLAAELVLNGAVFTQDAWETNLGLGEGLDSWLPQSQG